MHLARFAAAVTMAAVPLCASAAELFPYNPPSPSPAPQFRSQEQRVVPSEEFSRDEIRAIDELATKTNRLRVEQRREVRAAIMKSLEEALARRDWRQVAYYTELLRRIRDDR